MGKYALIVVFGFVKRNLDRVDASLADSVTEKFTQSEAKMTAHGLANMALVALSDSTSWRTGFAGVAIGGGTGSVALADSDTDTTLSYGQVRIMAEGSSGGTTDTVTVVALVAMLPPGVHGSITANSDVFTLGTLIIDGRDHDLNGNLLLGQGTKGVSTTQTFSQGGNVVGGGTDVGIDYAPSKPANPAVIEELATYAFPSDPDDVFGYPSGALKAIAQTGVNGSQYVTDPSSLTFPLSGVTYVELPNGGIWQDIDFGASSGLLVVHNSWTNALMKTLNAGTFKGLIITDDIDKIHCAITGAIVSMTTAPAGNCIGNGSGSVLYSSAALELAGSQVLGINGGFAVAYWLE